MILHAAIRHDGVTYLGKRHHLIIRDIVDATGVSRVVGEQGFVTDDCPPVFLDREQAGRHALACGQIKELKFSSRDLFSEELW